MEITEIWRYPVKTMGGEKLVKEPLSERSASKATAWFTSRTRNNG